MKGKITACVLLCVLLTSTGTDLWSMGLARIRESFSGVSLSQGELPETEEESTGPILETLLYFRFLDTGYLGMEKIGLDLGHEETVATAIVERLIAGPDADHPLLSGVFPEGTRLLSATSDGQTAYITLSVDFLGKPTGAPENWEDLEEWQQEAALRRRLALQSIVLALTEQARVQRVQLYVAQTDDDVPQRLPLAWFDSGITDLQTYLGACGRDEGIALTVKNSVKLALESWQQKNWAQLYSLMQGMQTGQEEFVRTMEERGVDLISFSLSDGILSADVQRATLVLDAEIQTATGERTRIERESILLECIQDNWMLSGGTLDRLMIRD